MAFKLLVEVTSDGSLNINHEGQIEPIILLGALRTLEHDILMTVSAMNAEAAMNAVSDKKRGNMPDTQGE